MTKKITVKRKYSKYAKRRGVWAAYIKQKREKKKRKTRRRRKKLLKK